jgi:hypothetical protein
MDRGKSIGRLGGAIVVSRGVGSAGGLRVAVTEALRHDPLVARASPQDHEMAQTVWGLIHMMETVHADFDGSVTRNWPDFGGAGFERPGELSTHVIRDGVHEGGAANAEPIVIVEELQIVCDHRIKRFQVARVEGGEQLLILCEDDVVQRTPFPVVGARGGERCNDENQREHDS